MIPSTIIDEFHKYTKTSKTYSNKSDYQYFSIRDNCGQAALDLISFIKLKYKEDKVIRIQGYFTCEIPLHDKPDFTREMRKEFDAIKLLNWNLDSDRLKFITESKYCEELKKCPHYWCSFQGKILDPSGDMQFIKTKMSKNLNASHYIKVKANV